MRPTPAVTSSDADQKSALACRWRHSFRCRSWHRRARWPRHCAWRSRTRLQPAAAASLRAQVAQVLFTANDDENALRVVQDSLKNTASSDQNSLTWYVAGLAAWRLDRFNDARMFFQGGADAAITTPNLHAACAFWASRAARQQKNARETIRWLKIACHGSNDVSRPAGAAFVANGYRPRAERGFADAG